MSNPIGKIHDHIKRIQDEMTAVRDGYDTSKCIFCGKKSDGGCIEMETYQEEVVSICGKCQNDLHETWVEGCE